MTLARAYITDEDFDNDVLRGLVRLLPSEDLLLIIECSLPADWSDPVRYLPL